MSRIFLFFFILFACDVFLYSNPVRVRYASISDVHKIKHEITARYGLTRMDEFYPGMKVFIFRAKKIIAEAVIIYQSSSGFLAKYSGEVDILRGDKIALKVEDIEKIHDPGKTIVNYEDIGYDAHGWISKVFYLLPGETSATESNIQSRKLVFGDQLGVLLEGASYYSLIETENIFELHFQWHNSRLKPVKIVFKDNKEIKCNEVLSPYILTRVKPPSALREKEVYIKIQLVSKKEAMDVDPASLPVSVNLQKVSSVFLDKLTPHIKVYADGMFVQEFILDKKNLDKDQFEKIFYLPGYSLKKGENIIEFFLTQTEKMEGFVFEKGDENFIGMVKIYFDADRWEHHISIHKNGVFPFKVTNP